MYIYIYDIVYIICIVSDSGIIGVINVIDVMINMTALGAKTTKVDSDSVVQRIIRLAT